MAAKTDLWSSAEILAPGLIDIDQTFKRGQGSCFRQVGFEQPEPVRQECKRHRSCGPRCQPADPPCLFHHTQSERQAAAPRRYCKSAADVKPDKFSGSLAVALLAPGCPRQSGRRQGLGKLKSHAASSSSALSGELHQHRVCDIDRHSTRAMSAGLRQACSRETHEFSEEAEAKLRASLACLSSAEGEEAPSPLTDELHSLGIECRRLVRSESCHLMKRASAMQPIARASVEGLEPEKSAAVLPEAAQQLRPSHPVRMKAGPIPTQTPKESAKDSAKENQCPSQQPQKKSHFTAVLASGSADTRSLQRMGRGMSKTQLHQQSAQTNQRRDGELAKAKLQRSLSSATINTQRLALAYQSDRLRPKELQEQIGQVLLLSKMQSAVESGVDVELQAQMCECSARSLPLLARSGSAASTEAGSAHEGSDSDDA